MHRRPGSVSSTTKVSDASKVLKSHFSRLTDFGKGINPYVVEKVLGKYNTDFSLWYKQGLC